MFRVVVRLQKYQQESKQRQTRLEISRLNREAKAVFSPATFSQTAKLERRAQKLEKELAHEQQAHKDKLKRLALVGKCAKSFQVRYALLTTLHTDPCANI